MPVTSEKPAPYTAASSVLDLMQRHRTKGLPQPVDNDVLVRAGISDSLIPRTLQALQTLDLIDEQGKITSIFEGLRLAPEAEYKNRLEAWLRSAYADVLQFVDPAIDDEIKIRDAFRSYNPVGQQSRMVSLFIALFAAAGISPAKQAFTRTNQINRVPAPKRKNIPKLEGKSQPDTNNAMATVLPPALEGLLKSLPQNGKGWSQSTRDKFITAFGTVVDLCFTINDNEIFETIPE